MTRPRDYLPGSRLSRRSRTRSPVVALTDQGLGCTEAPGTRGRGGGDRPVRAADAAENHIEQAKKFAQSLARGEPNREKIALTVLADRVRELV